MANYYRVNLKDKMGNIVYPNIHNLISIDKTTGGMTFSQGGITLSNNKITSKGLLSTSHLYLNGVASSTTASTANLIFGNSTTQYVVLRANTGHSLVIADSMTDNTNGIGYAPNDKAFRPTTNNILSLGNSTYRWTGIYSVKGNFSGTITSSITTGTHLAGNKGENVIINSTNTATDAYVILARFKSNNGVFTMGRWGDSFHLFYTAQSIVDAGTNSTSKNLELLNESGNSNFPGMIKAGNQIQASTAGAYRIAMGGGDSYAWIDCRDSSDTMKTNMTLSPSRINLYKNTYIGGTLLLTDNISIERHGSTQIPLKVYGGDANGQGISLGAGGATLVGSGESAKNAEAETAATTEQLRLLSDTDILFTTNAQTWDSRVSVYLNASRQFYPASTNTGSLGISGNVWGNVYATRVSSQLNKMSTFYNAGTQGISYHDGEAMSTTVSNNGWATPNAGWFQILHLDLSVDNYFNDIYVPVNEHNCLWWRQRRGSTYYGFMSIPVSTDNTVRVFRAGAIATWNSNYSNYVNGTVMFCW